MLARPEGSGGRASANAASMTHLLRGVLRSYAAIFFSNSAIIGALFLAATFFYPNTAVTGLLAALVGMVTARLLHFPSVGSGLYVYNSLLVGLALGATYRFDLHLFLLTTMSAVFAVFLTVSVADLLWRTERLPALSIPFVIVALFAGFAAKGYGTLSHYLYPQAPHATFLAAPIDSFLTAMGSTFFVPDPGGGLLLFLGILLVSRYLALLAVAGYATGHLFFWFLTGNAEPALLNWSGFNFILTAMALGGIFTVPGVRSFLLAIVGSALAAMLTASFQSILVLYGLKVMALPFLLTTVTILVALSKRVGLKPPWLFLVAPGLPEQNFERARLARVRTGEIGSVPLELPFFGAWSVSQGFDGKHTHKASWRHAIDFLIEEHGRTYRSDPSDLHDYYCFGLPVISPVHGQVVRLRDNLPDNSPGEVDTQNNFGNFVMIRLASGLCVLLAHLKEGSCEVAEGEFVAPGQPVGKAGSSGRSPQPHLHVQVQADAALGSPTLPFHFSGIVARKGTLAPQTFHLAYRPAEGDLLSPAMPDRKLVSALHLPVGRCLDYRLYRNGKNGDSQTLTVVLTLCGRFRLKNDGASSVAFEEHKGVLAFYDSQGPRHPLLNLYLLALGVTPLTSDVREWSDAPPAALLPLGPSRNLLRILRFPLGAGLDSRYERWFDEETGGFVQQGHHSLAILPGITFQAKTTARIKPGVGVTNLTLACQGNRFEARLEASGQIPDRGIPSWKRIADDEARAADRGA